MRFSEMTRRAQVFRFDLESPARRRRPEGDDAFLDPRKLAASSDGIGAPAPHLQYYYHDNHHSSAS